MAVTSESDDEMAPPPSYRAGMDRRRKSVFAESYEPGNEDELVEKVIHYIPHMGGHAQHILTCNVIHY